MQVCSRKEVRLQFSRGLRSRYNPFLPKEHQSGPREGAAGVEPVFNGWNFLASF